MGDALVERGESPSLIEIWGVDSVSRGPELVGKRKESSCLSLRVMKQHDFGHLQATLHPVDIGPCVCLPRGLPSREAVMACVACGACCASCAAACSAASTA